MESLESSSSIAMEESRRKRREFLQEQREFNRLKAFELNRFVESEIITEKDIAGLCSRIKRRKHATAEDLTKLGNAFIQNEANISAFIKTTGAINIIIKEFTGNDHNQQLLAAQCLCNLSLGDETCCTKIATFAGSYLMIFMMKLSDTSMAVSFLLLLHSLNLTIEYCRKSVCGLCRTSPLLVLNLLTFSCRKSFSKTAFTS